MKKFLSLFVAAIGIAVCCSAAESPVKRENILFLAHFNDSLRPEIAQGGQTPVFTRKATSTMGAGYKFKNSLPAAGGLSLTLPQSCVSYRFPGNFDASAGTLQLMYRFNGGKRGNGFQRIFSVVLNPARRAQVEQERVSGFLITKQENKWIIEFRNMLTYKRQKITAPVKWQPGEWHQIAVTWEKGGKKVLYLDGAKVAEEQFFDFRGEFPPSEILFGSPAGSNDAEGDIDEVRILNIALTPQQIAADYQRMLDGQEFEPVSSVKQESLTHFSTPYTPVKEKAAASSPDRELYDGKSANVYFTLQPVKIDGDLSDAAWKNIPALPAMIERRSGKAPKAATEIKVLYDEKYIYFAGKFDEPFIEKMSLHRDQRDIAVFDDDCLEMILDYANSPESTIHFAINLIGGIYDSLNGKTRFNAEGMIVKGKKHKDHWTLEVAIPFADLGIQTPSPGESWGYRIARERKAQPELSSYPRVASGGFGQRSYLSKLIFAGSYGENSTFSAKLTSEKLFLPGFNPVKLQISNTDSKDAEFTFRGSLLSANGLRIVESRKVNVPAGKSVTVSFDAAVPALDTRQIIIELLQGSRVVWRSNIAPGFKSPAIMPDALKRRLARMRADLNLWEARSLPVAQAMQVNYDKINGEITKIENAMSAAIKNRTTVSAEIINAYAENAAGFINWLNSRAMTVENCSVWENGSPDDLPQDFVSPQLTFRQLGNEWEYRGLNITGLLPGGGMDYRLAISDFYDSTNKKIVKRSRFKVYFLPYIREPGGALKTDVLLERDANEFTLLPAVSRKIVIACHTKDVAPGIYRGTITIKPVDVRAADRQFWKEIPVTLQVLNVSLPETCDWPMDSFFWYGNDWVAVEDEIPFIDLLEKHHIKWMMTNRLRYDRGRAPDGLNGVPQNPEAAKNIKPGLPYFDPANIKSNDRFLRAVREKRMRLVFGWNTCHNPDWVEQMSKHLLSLGFTYDDFLFSGLGDEFNAKAFEKYKPFHHEVRRRTPEVKWMCTMVTYCGLNDRQYKELSEIVDVPILYNAYLWPRGNQHEARAKRFLGHNKKLRPWIYRCGIGMQRRSLQSYYRLFPMLGHLTDVKGVAMWTLLNYHGTNLPGKPRQEMLDPYFDCENPRQRSQDGICYLHPTKNILPTKRFIAFSEGLEDVAMIHILKEKLASATPRQKQIYGKLISDKHLNDLYRNASQAEIDSWRESMLDAFENLKK